MKSQGSGAAPKKRVSVSEPNAGWAMASVQSRRSETDGRIAYTSLIGMRGIVAAWAHGAQPQVRSITVGEQDRFKVLVLSFSEAGLQNAVDSVSFR